MAEPAPSNGLRDALIVQTLEAIRDSTRAQAEATAAIARAVACQTESVGAIATALTIGERLRAIEEHSKVCSDDRARHRDEHKAITAKAFTLLLGAVGTLVASLVTLWIATHP